MSVAQRVSEEMDVTLGKVFSIIYSTLEAGSHHYRIISIINNFGYIFTNSYELFAIKNKTGNIVIFIGFNR